MTGNQELAKKVAENLLQIKAVKLIYKSAFYLGFRLKISYLL
jgi:hypothetical protein